MNDAATYPAPGVLADQRVRRPSPARRLARLAARKPLGAFGAFTLILMIVVAITAGLISPYDPVANDQIAALQLPSASHLFGTDQFGRDVFSRVIYGARISLYVGVGATIVSMIPAVIIGIVSAYFGGAIDYVIQRVVDAIQAIPGLILLIAIMVVLGPSLLNVIIALSFGGAFRNSRVIRSAALAIFGNTYFDAARVIGASPLRIMVRHMLPNIVPTIIVIASLGFGQLIIAEASVSFLGYGIQPPTPSWGNMLSADGRAYMYAQPWILIGPAVALALVVFGVNMFGDAVRDLIDPRLRGSN